MNYWFIQLDIILLDLLSLPTIHRLSSVSVQLGIFLVPWAAKVDSCRCLNLCLNCDRCQHRQSQTSRFGMWDTKWSWDQPLTRLRLPLVLTLWDFLAYISDSPNQRPLSALSTYVSKLNALYGIPQESLARWRRMIRAENRMLVLMRAQGNLLLALGLLPDAADAVVRHKTWCPTEEIQGAEIFIAHKAMLVKKNNASS